MMNHIADHAGSEGKDGGAKFLRMYKNLAQAQVETSQIILLLPQKNM